MGVFETIGIRLGIWTRPTDVEVPPFPWARVGIVAGILLVGGVVLTVVLLAESDRDAERERRALAAERRELRASAEAEQRPHRARLGQALPAGARADDWRRGRDRLIVALEDAITRDARARHRRKDLAAEVSRTECVPFVRPHRANPPQPPAGTRIGRYECLAITREVAPTSRTGALKAGFPFWARVEFMRGRAVWCKVRPRPGEGGFVARLEVPLPRVCDLRRS